MTNNFLKQEYTDNMTEKAGCDLAVATICKTLDSNNPNPERLEVIVVRRKEETEELLFKKLSLAEVSVIIDAKKKKEEEEAAKKK